MQPTEHTKTPWIVSKAVCHEHHTETVAIYHYPNPRHCIEVLETGCKCGDESLTEADANYIVEAVNAYEELKQQRDELLAAINEMDSIIEDAWKQGKLPHDVFTGPQVRAYKAVIAKVSK
jgi:hypothetical protein